MENQEKSDYQIAIERANELMKDNVVISKKEWEELLEDSNFLSCLRVCGVDNWSGYSDAQEMYSEEFEN